MGVIISKSKKYSSLSTQQTDSEFSSINMTRYTDNDGMSRKPNVQEAHFRRVLTAAPYGGKYASRNAEEVCTSTY